MGRKRLHYKNAAYMLTSVSIGRFPFFEEDIFCNIFLDVLARYEKLKSFKTIAFKINPDHHHIIIQPKGNYNISQIMGGVKRVSSDQINQLIYANIPNQDNPYHKLKWTPDLKLYKRQLNRKNNFALMPDFPTFKWLASFDDQLMKSRKQLNASLRYLEKQANKHELKENKFLMIPKKLPDDIFFVNGDKTNA